MIPLMQNANIKACFQTLSFNFSCSMHPRLGDYRWKVCEQDVEAYRQAQAPHTGSLPRAVRVLLNYSLWHAFWLRSLTLLCSAEGGWLLDEAAPVDGSAAAAQMVRWRLMLPASYCRACSERHSHSREEEEKEEEADCRGGRPRSSASRRMEQRQLRRHPSQKKRKEKAAVQMAWQTCR